MCKVEEFDVKKQAKKHGEYQHLTLEEREEIAIGLESGKAISQIARELGRSKASISRELKRNSPYIRNVKYRANRAHKLYIERKRNSHRRERLKSPEIRKYVESHLVRDDWTPEKIAGRLSLDHRELKTNHESIYQWIYKERRDLIEKLVRGHRKRHKRTSAKQRRVGKIPNRVDISERPPSADTRKEAGHWECDTVISRQSKECVAVFVERMSRLFIAVRMKDKSAAAMYRAAEKALGVFPPEMLKTVTFDNGTENAMHEWISESLGAKAYFCRPYHSWEKGSIENRNGILRRYFPKKTNWKLTKKSELDRVVQKINSTPMKLLGFKTPLEVFAELTAVALTP